MTNQEAYDVLNDAFSEFFVADKNTTRLDTHELDVDIAVKLAVAEGTRVGTIVGYLARGRNAASVSEAVYLCNEARLLNIDDPIVDDDGPGLPFSHALASLCLKYQLDEHRHEVINTFARNCAAGIVSQVGDPA